ncbi:hypothetical protein M0R45_032301 [Rubus argutus]|uniref:Chorein N-terminal domain-containing protein n=1 Tax=Rubus argutus TaxID=59490 RepID=A0AAW1WGH3_RUBAR
MFEGVVHQVLQGFLGRYVKDIHKHQLKITIWNEEVFLENAELSIEAFDYLQLPFALKEGRIGKISIKIPWKKLGWNPLVISLENVFLCASQRDDEEWSLDEVEKREFDGKKAKLAAAELAKLSKRVCENQAGFRSIITAKVLDSIQVLIKDFHILYHDKLSDPACNIFGLKFSNLRTMKQNPFGSVGRGRGAQVNKTVEIMGLEFYCGTFDGVVDLMTMDNDCKKYNSILSPCDVSMSLSVNISGELDSKNPLNSVTAEVTGLVMSIDEVQLQQILILWDYLCTCEMRNKYEHYRPWYSPLSKNVNLYKTTLDFLRHHQPIDESTRWELEKMEKELDIDDILSYRSAAECELQFRIFYPCEFYLAAGVFGELFNWKILWMAALALGMLGAGGTNYLGQFSGAVSDVVIKDMYEEVECNPPILSNGPAGCSNKR